MPIVNEAGSPWANTHQKKTTGRNRTLALRIQAVRNPSPLPLLTW
jgi:hypothetical protein